MTTPSVNLSQKHNYGKKSNLNVGNYFSQGANESQLRQPKESQKLFGGASSSFVYGGAPMTPNSRAGISEKEKNLSDQIR